MTFAPDGTALILEGNVLLSGTIIQNSVATEISPDMSTVTSWQPVWGGPNMRGIATDIELYTAPGTQLALASIRAYDASQPTTTSQG